MYDSRLHRLSDEISDLNSQIVRMKEEDRDPVVRQFLLSNAQLIDKAIKIVSSRSDEELEAAYRANEGDLNPPGGSFPSYVSHAGAWASDPESFHTFDADHVEVLGRVVRYASYFAGESA